METEDRIAAYLEKLEGISYFDWMRLHMAVDEVFARKKNELERDLKLVIATKEERHSTTT